MDEKSQSGGKELRVRTVAKSGPYVAHMYELSYIVSVTKDKVILINAQSVVASPVPASSGWSALVGAQQ